MNAVLYTTLETIRTVGLLVQPFVPEAADLLARESPDTLLLAPVRDAPGREALVEAA